MSSCRCAGAAVWTVPLGQEAVDGVSAPHAPERPEPDNDLWHLQMTLPRYRPGGTGTGRRRTPAPPQPGPHGRPAFSVKNLDPPAPAESASAAVSGPEPAL